MARLLLPVEVAFLFYVSFYFCFYYSFFDVVGICSYFVIVSILFLLSLSFNISIHTKPKVLCGSNAFSEPTHSALLHFLVRADFLLK